jgi:hypothetical protein
LIDLNNLTGWLYASIHSIVKNNPDLNLTLRKCNYYKNYKPYGQNIYISHSNFMEILPSVYKEGSGIEKVKLTTNQVKKLLNFLPSSS